MTADIAGWRESPEQDLLVLTDGHHRGRRALTLPFREATVVEEGAVPDWTGITGMFDTVVIERSDLDPDRLAAAARAGLAAMRPDGQLIVTLGAPPGDLEGPASGWLDDLSWRGLTTLDGVPCTVLSRAVPVGAGPPTATAARFASAADAVGVLAAAPDTASLRAAVGYHLQQRHRSEHALLGHLESVVTTAGGDRRSLRSVRARVAPALRRYRAGRALLRAARRLRTARRR